MQRLFGVPWGDLTIKDVEAFFAEAGDEGLTWEAKGGDLPHRGSIRKAVCGFANAVGGYLILGAERQNTEWALPGLTFPNREPGTWISSVLERGLEPAPPIDLAPFKRAEGRHVVVIRVPPIAAPPSITADGTVYRRVSGQTLPVTSQLVLTELIDAGRAAREQAEQKALLAAQRALGEPTGIAGEHNIFALALCPVEGPDDRPAVLFAERFVKSLRELVDTHLQAGFMRHPVGIGVHQTNVHANVYSSELSFGRMAIAFWDGAVGVVYAGVEIPSVEEMTTQVPIAWEVAARAVAELGGAGETHVVLHLNPNHEATTRRASTSPLPIKRWTASVDPEPQDVARVQRELRRSLGERTLEP